MIDSEEVARVRCWHTDDNEAEPDSPRDVIRGGTIRRVPKPSGSRVLALNEVRVIELCNGERDKRSERLFGRALERVSCGCAVQQMLR
ncbi:MAG: hypothetical protein HC933_09565 [Pleurocapsa sp. SU_196_0]|nr:hypothetical protein [Pleurocapsa sp. SU_196_0]